MPRKRSRHKMRRAARLACLAVCLSAALPVQAQQRDDIGDIPSGTYKLDPAHASLVWRVSHLGLSNYTARFTRLDATLHYDRVKPEDSSITVMVDPTSIQTDYPMAETLDFDKELQGADWFDVAKYPSITFTSTKVVRETPTSGQVEGDLAMHGATRPITIDIKLNGAYLSHPFLRKPALGFSGHAVIHRSDFGITRFDSMVGDDVDLQIEAEFNKID